MSLWASFGWEPSVLAGNRVYDDSCKQEKRTERERIHASRPRRHSAPKRDHSEIAKPDKAPGHYYEVLGLQNGATKNEVQQAYRDLVKVWHPDRFSADDERLRRKAEAKLRELNEAFANINSTASSASADSVAHFVDVNDAIRLCEFRGALRRCERRRPVRHRSDEKCAWRSSRL